MSQASHGMSMEVKHLGARDRHLPRPGAKLVRDALDPSWADCSQSLRLWGQHHVGTLRLVGLRSTSSLPGGRPSAGIPRCPGEAR